MNHSPEGWIAEQDSLKVEAAIAKMSEREPEYARTYANGDPYFGLWLRLVDQHAAKLVQVAATDLSDWMSHDAYESGMSPREGALEALSNDDLYATHLDELGIR